MAQGQAGAILRHIRSLVGTQAARDLTDSELLRRYVSERDEAAFTALLQRYARLVWGICGRLLRHEQDAEDAFQATFLVLARKAGSIRKGEAVGSWLYGVAYRVAMRAKKTASQRRGHERQTESRFEEPAVSQAALREMQALLDAEVSRLPEKCRAPFVLCCLEGKSKTEAARELGWKEGTVSSRLAKARKLLQGRLARRGVSLSAVLSSAALAPSAAQAVVPAQVIASTVRACLSPAPGGLTAAVSTEAAALAQGVIRAMIAAKLKAGVAVLLALGFCAAGAGLAARNVLAPAQQTERDSQPKPVAKGVDRPTPAQEKHARTDRYGDPLPEGALLRLGTVRYRFAPVGSAFLPDGKTVVSVKQDSIVFWDARTGRLKREIDTGNFSTGQGGITLSSDGRRLAVSGSVHNDGKPGWRSAARVLDLSTGKAIRTIERLPREGVAALAMSPDGKMLFTLDRNGKLRVEEVATGAELLRQQFPGDVMASIAVSPDGSTLALGSGPNTHKISIWKWQMAGEPRAAESGGHRGREVVFSPDGKLLAECSDTEPDVRLLDVASGRVRHKLEQPDHEPYRHFHVAFSPNGKLLAAYGGTNDRFAVNLWDPTTGKFVQRIESGGALAFSPDSTLLVAGSHVWDFAAGKELSANDEAHVSEVERIVTGAKDLVATAGEDNTIRIWDGATGQHRRRLVLDSFVSFVGQSIRGIALSPAGTRLVAISMRDDRVYLWDVTTGKRIYKLAGHGKLGSIAAAAVFMPDGKSFLTWGAADMCLRKWDVRTGKALAEHVIRPAGIHVPSEDDEPMERERFFMNFGGAQFTADAKHLVFQAGDKFFVFDTATGNYVRSFPSEERIGIGMAISPDGKLVLATAWGKSVQTKLPDSSTQFLSPKNHPVTLWDLTKGQLRKQILLPEQGAGPVAFAPDGQLFAVASSRPGSRIRFIETATGREVRKIEGFRGVVRSLAFTPDGKRLVSGMDDSSALVWDLTRER